MRSERLLAITLLVFIPAIAFGQNAPAPSSDDLGWVWIDAKIGDSPSFFLEGKWYDSRTSSWVESHGWFTGRGYRYRGKIYVPDNELHGFLGLVKSPKHDVWVNNAMVKHAAGYSGFQKKNGWMEVPAEGLIVNGHLHIPSTERGQRDLQEAEEVAQRKQDKERDTLRSTFASAVCIACPLLVALACCAFRLLFPTKKAHVPSPTESSVQVEAIAARVKARQPAIDRDPHRPSTDVTASADWTLTCGLACIALGWTVVVPIIGGIVFLNTMQVASKAKIPVPIKAWIGFGFVATFGFVQALTLIAHVAR